MTSPSNRQRAKVVLIGLAALVLFVPAKAFGGDVGPPPGANSPPWDGETFRRYQDDATGTFFDVPMLGFRVESRHFDRKTPADRVKDMFTVSGPGGQEVTIDVFDNPDGLSLSRFFDTHLGFMNAGNAAVTSGNASARKVPALFVEQRKAAGSYAQPSAIFALNGRIYRVTCANEDDARAVKVYFRVLSTLDVGKAAR